MPEAALAAAENSNGAGNSLTKNEQAKIRRATDPKKIVKDKDGVTRFIVDMIDDGVAKAPVILTDDALIDWHKDNSKYTIQKVLRNSGSNIKPLLSLENSLPGVIAYLTEKQVEQLAKDKLVSRITEDHYSEMSAPPPISTWFDTLNSPGTQTRSWGIKAMNNLYPTPSNGAGPIPTQVFVIDLGTSPHPDLNSVERLAAFPNDFYGFPTELAGCWPHATHVAGIIAAADNSQGVVGMLPNVQIISIAMGDAGYYLAANNTYQGAYSNASSTRVCSGGNYEQQGLWTVGGAAAALDIVMQRASKGGAIVNMSFNGFGLFRYGQTLWDRMRSVATPRWVEGTPWLNDSYAWYKGSLIVQSAGNNGVGACDYAYESTDPFDGIIVVGGLDETGNRLNPPGGIGGDPINSPGSNMGACVEMWAPSNNIKSTWTDVGQWGNPTGYSLLTGTSMAAPHIAGFAAAVRQQNPVESSSRRLEQQVRQLLYTLPTGYQMPSF